MLLGRWNICNITSLDSFSEIVETVGHGRVISADINTGKKAKFVCNKLSSKYIDLFYLHSNITSLCKYTPVSYYRIVFPLRKSSTIKSDKKVFDADYNGSGFVLPPNLPVEERHATGFDCLAVRLTSDCIQKRLSALVDDEARADLQFFDRPDIKAQIGKFIREPLFSLCREIELFSNEHAQTYLETFQDFFVTRLLLHTTHSYAARLSRPVAEASRKQIALAADYLRDNPNRLVTQGELARLAGVSERTLNRAFIKTFGVSISQYGREVRLRRACELLMNDPDASVMEVALKCGFQSPGNFARLYRQKFGMLPSRLHANNKDLAKLF